MTDQPTTEQHPKYYTNLNCRRLLLAVLGDLEPVHLQDKHCLIDSDYSLDRLAIMLARVEIKRQMREEQNKTT